MNKGVKTDTQDETAEQAAHPPDVCVGRGEFVVRRHLTPRTALFSPTQWLYETGNVSIPIIEEDGHFQFMDLERLEVSRGTVPDSKYMGTHWDTWIGDANTNQKMPIPWHSGGMPVYWTGETQFQVARPRRFRCPKTDTECT